MTPLTELLTKLESGSRPKGGVKDIKEGIPSIGGEHLDSNGGFKFEKIKFVPEEFAEKMKRGQIQRGDILIVKDGATTSKTSLVRDSFPFDQAVVNEHVFICRCAEPTDSKYLFYFLFSAKGKAQILKDFRGAAQGGISQKFVEKVIVPLAPTDQRRMIVEEIEKQFSRLDEAVTSLKRAKANLKRYKAAVLKAAVEGKLTEEWRKQHPDIEPASELLKRILAERRRKWEEAEIAKMRAKGKAPKDEKWKRKYKEPIEVDSQSLPILPGSWVWATVDQLAAAEERAITDGPFGSNLKTSHYTDIGPRVIRLQNIGVTYFIDEEAHISEDHYQGLIKHSVETGDIILAALGDPAPRACSIPSWLGKAIVKADCIRFRTSKNIVASYVMYALNSWPTQKRTESIVHGIGRPRLNLGEIKSIAIPLPPIKEQEMIHELNESNISITSKYIGQLRAEIFLSERLRQSTLNKAFSGGLV